MHKCKCKTHSSWSHFPVFRHWYTITFRDGRYFPTSSEPECENVIRLTFRWCTDKSHNSDIFFMRWPCLIVDCFLTPLLSQSHCLLAAIYTFQMIFNLQSVRAGLAALCHFLPPFTFLHLLQSISLRLSNSSLSVFLPQAFISTGCFYQWPTMIFTTCIHNWYV